MTKRYTYDEEMKAIYQAVEGSTFLNRSIDLALYYGLVETYCNNTDYWKNGLLRPYKI